MPKNFVWHAKEWKQNATHGFIKWKIHEIHVEINFNNIFPDNRNYNVLINNYNSVSYVPGWVLGVQLEN